MHHSDLACLDSHLDEIAGQHYCVSRKAAGGQAELGSVTLWIRRPGHGGDGLDCVVEAVAALPAVAKALVVLHAGEGMVHAGPHASMFGRVRFQAGQEAGGRTVSGAG